MAIIKFEEFYLDNGLKVLVHQDMSVMKVAMDIIYRVGARDERAERTGFAHLFEHLMFGGSKNIPDFDTQLQKVGGDCNAFTTSDITNYYLSLPAYQLEIGFWLESDRMLELDFSQKSLDVQKSVVCEEFKQRYLNQPYGDAHLHLRELHYKKHPYRWMTIGKELSHIETAVLEEVKEFFFNFYAPNNATLVVAGGVTLEQVKKLAQKWFGPIPRREVKRLERPAEPRQQEVRIKTVHSKVPYPAVYKAFHIPSRTSPDYYSADVMSDLFGNAKSSRLYQQLVKEKKVASSISAFSWGLYDAGILTVEARISQNKTVEDFEVAFNEVLEEMKEIKQEEISRLLNRNESIETFEKTEVANKATTLALYDSIGDPNLINTIMEKYRKTTVSDVQNAVKEYLRKDNCSTLYYLPE